MLERAGSPLNKGYQFFLAKISEGIIEPTYLKGNPMRTILIVLGALALIVLFPPIGVLAVLIWLIVTVANMKTKK